MIDCPDLELMNFERGNRRYLMIKTAPDEGEDFETITDEKLWLASKQARDIIDETIGDSMRPISGQGLTTTNRNIALRLPRDQRKN